MPMGQIDLREIPLEAQVLGVQSTLWDEAVKIAGADPDFHRRDLFTAITAGDFPQWDLAVQLFSEEDAAGFPFDHLDSTKVVPEELVPLTVIGRLTLDRWPDNFFAETEQVAFCPANMVPGIDISDDPLLHGRLFSYLDTQLSRLGGPNFHQLPVNAPRCPFANHQRDGHMQMAVPKGRVAYEPSSLDPAGPRESVAGFRSHPGEAVPLAKTRVRAESFADHYSHARLFYRSQLPVEQDHIVAALVFELSKVETAAIRQRMVGNLVNVDEDLARRVAGGIGLAEVPPAAEPARQPIDLPPSPALGLIGKATGAARGRMVGVLFDKGSDGKRLDALAKACEREGVTVAWIAPTIGAKEVGGRGPRVADRQLAGNPSCLFDAVAVVLSEAAAARLVSEAAAVDFVRDAFGHLKMIAADAGGQVLVATAGLEPDPFVVDADAIDAFVAGIGRRHWEREPTVRQTY